MGCRAEVGRSAIFFRLTCSYSSGAPLFVVATCSARGLSPAVPAERGSGAGRKGRREEEQQEEEEEEGGGGGGGWGGESGAGMG